MGLSGCHGLKITKAWSELQPVCLFPAPWTKRAWLAVSELLPVDRVEEVVAGETFQFGVSGLGEGEFSPCVDDVFHE